MRLPLYNGPVKGKWLLSKLTGRRPATMPHSATACVTTSRYSASAGARRELQSLRRELSLAGYAARYCEGLSDAAAATFRAGGTGHLADEANEEWLRLNARGANGCAKFVYGAGR